MLNKILVVAIVFLIQACAMQEQGGKVKTDVFNPLKDQTWSVSGTDENVCGITSGHNGLNITLEKSNGNLKQLVSSGHSMRPYEVIRLNVNNHYYRSASENFSDRDSSLIIEDFKNGEVAYLEWSSLKPYRFDSGPKRASNILKLNNFKQVYNECLSELSKS